MAQYSDIIVLRILNFLFIYFMERIFKIYKVMEVLVFRNSYTLEKVL